MGESLPWCCQSCGGSNSRAIPDSEPEHLRLVRLRNFLRIATRRLRHSTRQRRDPKGSYRHWHCFVVEAAVCSSLDIGGGGAAAASERADGGEDCALIASASGSFSALLSVGDEGTLSAALIYSNKEMLFYDL